VSWGLELESPTSLVVLQAMVPKTMHNRHKYTIGSLDLQIIKELPGLNDVGTRKALPL